MLNTKLEIRNRKRKRRGKGDGNVEGRTKTQRFVLVSLIERRTTDSAATTTNRFPIHPYDRRLQLLSTKRTPAEDPRTENQLRNAQPFPSPPQFQSQRSIRKLRCTSGGLAIRTERTFIPQWCQRPTFNPRRSSSLFPMNWEPSPSFLSVMSSLCQKVADTPERDVNFHRAKRDEKKREREGLGYFIFLYIYIWLKINQKNRSLKRFLKVVYSPNLFLV